MKSFVLGFVSAFLLLPIGSLAYFAFGFSQIPADARPSSLETAFVQSAVRTSIRRSAAGNASPAKADNETLVAGGKLYVMGCMGCHGELGKPYREERDHFPPVPQLPHTGTQYSEPELYWIVKHGIRMTGMSAYGPFYSEKQLWDLAAFLHQINKLPPEVVESLLPKKAENAKD